VVISRGRCSLLAPALPPGEGEKEEKGDLQSEYKNNFTDNIINKRKKTKYTKPILSFPELGAGVLASHQWLQGRHQEVPDWTQQ